MVCLAALAGCGGAAPFGGTSIGRHWTPDGEAARRAEQMWWQVFQGQDYARTPELHRQLVTSLEGTRDPFTQALLHGRLGWFYLWMASESSLVETQDPPFPGLPPKTGLIAYNSAAFEPSAGAPPCASHKQPIDKAVCHFGAATDLVMEHVKDGPSRQRQDWTHVEIPDWGNPSVPRPWLQGPTPDGTFALSWRTFPSVVTGFYASFNGAPIDLANPRGRKRETISFRSTEDAVSYSLGFNFATNVLGHNGAHTLDSPPHPDDYPQESDDKVMLQMMQLAADEMVQDAMVFGSNDEMWMQRVGQASVLKQQDRLFKEFFQNNPAFTRSLPGLDYVPGAGTRREAGIWRRPKDRSSVRPGETPPGIVKVSSGSSTVVPFNFENNFLLLGDTLFIAYYAPPSGVVPEYWLGPSPAASLKRPPVEDWLPVVQSVYDYAASSPVFEDWPFKYQIEDRRQLLVDYTKSLAETDLETANSVGNRLYEYAQNSPEGRRPSCMTCHMRGTPRR